MMDFRPAISTNVRIYPGIVERIESLDNILNELDASGFGKLVQNFCTQPDPEKASDLLFEIWVCHRFLLQGVSFDMQVKRLLAQPYDCLF